ncbi:MAG: 6-carboxytetrahydropterin synthase [Pseudomonadota bacterium]
MKLFVNDLTVMDFSYLCPVRGMVGESWIVDIVLDGGLNEESMVQDFGIVKKQLKSLIDDYIDHKLVIPAESENTTVVHNGGSDAVDVAFRFAKPAGSSKYILLRCPSEAYAFVYANEIDKPSVIRYLKDIISTQLPQNVHAIDIVLREEHITSPYYHYTHGLKKHDGNCQRIAHGHRSKIIINEKGTRSEVLEQHWASKWEDIYIGTREDLVPLNACVIDEMARQYQCADADYYAFQYESSQGQFSMIIAKSVCDIIDADSTVECIAQHIFESTKQLSDSEIQVKAFEGVGKGAFVDG